MYIADLHIHSRFSRATSRDCDAPHLDWWARRKGIALLGTGDFTHPAWRAELKEQLVPAEAGLYVLREQLRLPGIAPGVAPRFVVTGEISSIYKRGGRTRKVHNLILLPSLGGGGRAFRTPGSDREHSLGRTAHPGPGQPRPAGTDAGDLSGSRAHPRAYLDAPFRHVRRFFRVRQHRSVLWRSDAAHPRCGNRPGLPTRL